MEYRKRMGKVEAIVYVSNAGHTRRYAKMLGEKTGLPVYELKYANKTLKKGASIIFMGWLLGGQVQGYAKAAKVFSIACLCGVGMAANGSQISDMRTKNHVSESLPLFSIQGGFDMNEVHGIYRLMMNMVAKVTRKNLEEKKEISSEDRQMLEMISEGKDYVCEENLTPVLSWYNSL